MTYSNRTVCHFDGGEISAKNSTKIDSRYGVTCGDFSSVEMTKLLRKALRTLKNFIKET